MLRSTERILTMHAGTTPRVPDLRQMVLDKSTGEKVDEAALTARLREAIAESVQRQVGIGLDSINDGELGKSSFTNYARERLTGHENRVADSEATCWRASTDGTRRTFPTTSRDEATWAASRWCAPARWRTRATTR